MKLVSVSLFLVGFVSLNAIAQPPEIVKAEAIVQNNQLFDFAVTIKHPDSGWDHYANEWVIIVDGDKEVAKRTLYHPHVNEQPFTRYLRDIKIPADVTSIKVIARCNKGHQSKPYVLFGE